MFRVSLPLSSLQIPPAIAAAICSSMSPEGMLAAAEAESDDEGKEEGKAAED